MQMNIHVQYISSSKSFNLFLDFVKSCGVLNDAGHNAIEFEASFEN